MNPFPPGWDEERVQRVLAHYQAQTAEEATQEDQAAFKKSAGRVMMEIPAELAPLIRALLSQYLARVKS